jgi:hypothetical protein
MESSQKVLVAQLRVDLSVYLYVRSSFCVYVYTKHAAVTVAVLRVSSSDSEQQHLYR